MSITIDGMNAYTIKEVVDLLKKNGNDVSTTMLKNYVKRGDIKTINIDGKHWIKECDIDWGLHICNCLTYRYDEISHENKDQGINQCIQRHILKI